LKVGLYHRVATGKCILYSNGIELRRTRREEEGSFAHRRRTTKTSRAQSEDYPKIS